MGKLADLASIKTANSDTFVYTPPDAAFNAPRILVKVNMAYQAGHPATVSLPVLAAVLRGLRRASPVGRILIVEGMTGEGDMYARFEQRGLTDILDREMRVSDSEELVLTRYLNTSPQPAKYDDLLAPAYIQEFDCAISVSPLKRTLVDGQPLISGTTKNLYELFPRHHYHGSSPNARAKLYNPDVNTVLPDVYFSVGWHFAGAVIDLTEFYDSPDDKPDHTEGVSRHVGKVVWGDDMVAVDAAACRTAGIDVPGYLTHIQKLRGD